MAQSAAILVVLGIIFTVYDLFEYILLQWPWTQTQKLASTAGLQKRVR